MLIACHQPNFLPWLGFFDKLSKADRFVLLDEVQFPRTSGGTYTNRVKLMLGGDEPRWLTVPVLRDGVQAIGEVRIDDRQPWRRKALKAIEQGYARFPGFSEVFPVVRAVLELETDRLAELNEAGIRALAPADAGKLVRQSSLGGGTGSGSALLASLVRAAGGTGYLAGDGAGEYEDEAAYADAGLGFELQGFSHPDTGGPPGLSLADARMRGFV